MADQLKLIASYDPVTEAPVYKKVDKAENDHVMEVDAASLANELVGGGYFVGSELALNEYDYIFFGRTAVVKYGSAEDKDIYRPIIYAVAYQAEPQAPNLRRASKTAALIGVEGGVVATTGKISGMQEVWNLDVPGIEVNTVAVTTSFDASTNSAILKDATFQNMQASGSVSAPIVAAQNLGATDLFSVGDCVTNVGNDGVTINAKSDACAPVFEVNAKTKEITLSYRGCF